MKNTNSDILIGSHVNMKGPDYLVGSANQAISYGANCLMLYTGPNQSTQRTPIDKLKIDEFHQLLNEHHITLKNVVVHAPYILNLANGDPSKWSFSVNFLVQELKRTEAIGANLFVLHPGSATNVSRQQGLDNIIKGINSIFERFSYQITICLETMAGKGQELGANFKEISYLIQGIKDKSRIGVCLDTCHINDAGYDLNHFDDILKEFDNQIGLKYLKVIHINDSMNKVSTHKDRHENIGYGTIGFSLLNQVVHHPKLANLPKILETPWYKDQPLYKAEIEMFRTNHWFDIKKQIH